MRVGQRRADDCRRSSAGSSGASARTWRSAAAARSPLGSSSSRRWMSPTSVELRRGHAASSQGAGQAARQPAGEQAGIDGAGDRRLHVDLGQHPDPGDVLHLAPAECPPGLADEDDAGGSASEGRGPPEREVAGAQHEQRRVGAGEQRLPGRPRHAEVDDGRPPARRGCGPAARPGSGTGPLARRRPAGTTRRPGVAGSLRCSMASASTPASANSQSRTPGPLGCGRPSAAGTSPARSTRRAPSGAEARAGPATRPPRWCRCRP